MLSRSLSRPLARPLARPLDGIWRPSALFQSGAKGAWYDISDRTTLYQDAAGTTPVTSDGDPVGLVLDKSGNGNHLSQSVSAARPTYRAGGGLHWLEADGVDDTLRAQYAADLAQPSTIVHAGSSSGDVYLGSHTSSTSRNLFRSDSIYAGAFLNFTKTTDDACRTAIFNGAGSAVRKNGVQVASGNAGTQASAGITLFSDYNLAPWYPGKLYSLLVVGGLLTSQELLLSETYLAKRAGVIL